MTQRDITNSVQVALKEAAWRPTPSSASIDAKADFLHPINYRTLASLEGCQNTLDDLFEADPRQFARVDLATLNLLCAPTLPGSEKLDIPHCLARVQQLAGFVKTSTDRNLYRFPGNADWGHSEPMWRMAMLVTNIKRDYGASYSPSALADLEASIQSPFSDSHELFIHGLLDDDPNRRWGTCTSIPVLVAAVARRLGYPVGLAVTRTHVFCRWENGICFNIEASNPAGMTSLPDEHYRTVLHGGLTLEERESGYYVRTLSPLEEFALFLKTRVCCLLDAARYDDTLICAARALQFSPTDPHFPKTAYVAADIAMKCRLWRKYPEQKLPAAESLNQPAFHVGDLLARSERSFYLTIIAHYKELRGQLAEARGLYEDACRQNFHGNNEQRDLQRFLRQHNLPRRTGPLLPPKSLGQPRCLKLNCRPEDEANTLRYVAAQCEHDGELLKAHGALHDLYILDPTDAGVFERARTIERHPRFQQQLRAVWPQRQRALGSTRR